MGEYNENKSSIGTFTYQGKDPEPEETHQRPTDKSEYSYDYYAGTPKVIKWVIKYSGGLIKNEKQANYVLLAGVMVVFVVSLLLVFSSGGIEDREFTPEEIKQLENAGNPSEISGFLK